MHILGRYFRLLFAMARFSLARELAFRGNFLAKVFVELLWLGILIIFYRTVFAKTSVIAGWSEEQYLFFVGCYFAMEGMLETFFLENCNEFGDLVRTGNLDIYLLQPIDEQFLITCRNIDWSTAPNVVLGVVVMASALQLMGWPLDPVRSLVFVVLFACGTAMAYSFLLILTSSSIWLMRNQSLFELWWLITSLMRYPREIFTGPLASPLGWFFTFIIPVLLVVSVPAEVMVKALDWKLASCALAATFLLLFGSRRFFRFALQKYRSASS